VPQADLPLVRILGHHSQVYAVMQAQEPANPGERCRVYLGEDGQRDDALAYRAPALAPGPRYNAVTAATAIPVLEALLPGSAPLRWSAPAPGGLAGGYPVLIANGGVTLDLPPGLTQQDAIAFNENMARGDGIERIDDDGTVHFTAASRDAIASIDPGLAEPLAIDDLQARAAALDGAVDTT
jgi:hypothetical protein